LVQATGLGSNILHLLVSISVCLQLRFVKLSINEYVMLCYVIYCTTRCSNDQ